MTRICLPSNRPLVPGAIQCGAADNDAAGAGFTLMEMLVVLAIMSALAIVISPYIGKRWSSIERQRLRVALEMAIDTSVKKARATGSTVIVELKLVDARLGYVPGLRKDVPVLKVYADGSTSGGTIMFDQQPILSVNWLTGRLANDG